MELKVAILKFLTMCSYIIVILLSTGTWGYTYCDSFIFFPEEADVDCDPLLVIQQCNYQGFSGEHKCMSKRHGCCNARDNYQSLEDVVATPNGGFYVPSTE